MPYEGLAAPGQYGKGSSALLEDLARRVSGEVGADAGSRALYATDASNYREVPVCVVLPRSVEDIVRTIEVCRRHDAAVVMRGGGTSLAGQAASAAVVIDTSRYCNHHMEIDPEERKAHVEPGVVLDDLRSAANHHGLTFGPDPSTHAWCTLGGMIGNNSGGVHSVTAGRTVDNVESLDVLTYDGLRMRVGPTSDDELARIIAEGGRKGEIYSALRELRDRYAELIRARYPDIPRRISGYNLDQLLPEKGFNVARALVGTEGTCVTMLGATVRLIPDPPFKSLIVVGFDSIYDAADLVPHIRDDLSPIGIEAIDDVLVQDMRTKHMRTDELKLLPEGDSWLLVEFGGQTREDAREQARRAADDLRNRGHVRDVRIVEGEQDRQHIWEVREAGLGGSAWVPRIEDTWPGWEDSAVAPEDLGAYLRELHALYDRYGYHGATYGHFGDGLVHTRISFGLHTTEAVTRFRDFMEDAAELVVRYGGTLSGEHGDGQARAELLPVMYGPELVRAFREFKHIWDPRGRMNPGRIVDPRPLDVDLRFGPRFHPPQLDTHFSYAEQGTSFARAVQRCVGVGKCRRMEGGTMCPSYRATRDERHSTRGRAHLLQEMLQGDPISDGWRSDAVREALDLCLACKGCKNDCPVNVDMATYKAEFLSHYYEGRWRPRAAYAMGQIHVLARLAAPFPWLANLLTQLPGFDAISKRVAGVHPDRPLPPFASRTFRRGAPALRNQATTGPLVVLWTDTFNNHFTPESLHAAVEVLQAAGCRVELPTADFCCGRPLFDYGMLDQARQTLVHTMDGLREQLDRGAWIVGLEPSCLATFRDELGNFFPNDPDAERLAARTVLFSEFLDEAADFEPPRIDRSAVFRAHCNHKAIFGTESDERLLRKAGLDLHVLDDGCCGMAGAFGYEADSYDVSMRIAEDKTLPAVRAADEETLIVCDGYSCREQILQNTGRRVLTTAEVLQKALREGVRAEFSANDDRYERARVQAARVGVAAAGTVALASIAFTSWRGANRRRHTARTSR